jgi:sirohydrochlorin cobaltochelatase
VNQSQAPALLIAGHGTRDEAGARELLALVERVRALAPDLRATAGFIELSMPPVSSAAA